MNFVITNKLIIKYAKVKQAHNLTKENIKLKIIFSLLNGLLTIEYQNIKLITAKNIVNKNFI